MDNLEKAYINNHLHLVLVGAKSLSVLKRKYYDFVKAKTKDFKGSFFNVKIRLILG